MGLTIHYKLAVAENIASAAARDLLEQVARYAKEIGCAEVTEVSPTDADAPFVSRFVAVGEKDEGRYLDVPPQEGWLMMVWPGEDCESAFFGLCQYPRTISFHGQSLPTGYTGGWVFNGFCKTQYAAEHGWAHFLKCHKTVIQILDFWKQLGVTVEVTDEGEFWESRSEEKLQAVLKKYDGLVAAFAGVLKDADVSVEAPILKRKDFERLEAAGAEEFKDQLSQLSRTDLDNLLNP